MLSALVLLSLVSSYAYAKVLISGKAERISCSLRAVEDVYDFNKCIEAETELGTSSIIIRSFNSASDTFGIALYTDRACLVSYRLIPWLEITSRECTQGYALRYLEPPSASAAPTFIQYASQYSFIPSTSYVVFGIVIILSVGIAVWIAAKPPTSDSWTSTTEEEHLHTQYGAV